MAVIEEETMESTSQIVQEIDWRLSQKNSPDTPSSAAELIHTLKTEGIPAASIESAMNGTDITPERKRLIMSMYSGGTRTLEETTGHWQSQGLLN